MCLPLLASAEEVQIDGLWYNLVSKAEVAEVIMWKNDQKYTGDIVIPSVITYLDVEYNVTLIGSSAFSSCNNLTSVSIPSSVITIGNSAFEGCVSLTSIVIPEGVTTLGSNLFSGCTNLESIVIPEGVTSLGVFAFYDCTSLNSIVIPEGVTTIGNYAFYGCAGLNSIMIPESVTSIGTNTFSGCNALCSINLPIRLTSIGDYAFQNCASLSSITIPEDVLTIGEGTFKNCASLTSVEIPSNVTSINNNAFQGCNGLISITMQEGLENIGNYAFMGCTSLSSIALPESLKTLGNYTFSGCSSLSSITIPESVTIIGNSTFYGCSGLTTVFIPSSVTSIGNYAFWGCSSLNYAKIPSSVVTIGNSAFSGCSGLTSIDIPNSVNSIGNSTFYGCSGLTNVTIPPSITTIPPSSFYGCKGMKRLSIVSDITSIGSKSFASCENLEEVYCLAKTPASIANDSFDGSYIEYTKLYVPVGSKAYYSSANIWMNFGDILEGGFDDIDYTNFIVNAGFDDDLTWQADGSKKEIIDQSYILSNRSIAGIAADNTVYALVNPATPNSRPDGRTLEATNGFIGQVKGWENVNNQTFPKCEWVYLGTLPYELENQAIPIGDDGSTFIEVPTRPEIANSENNKGFLYLRSGWGCRAVFKQNLSLPNAKYVLEFWAISTNLGASNGKNLSKVTCLDQVWEDETHFNNFKWTKHSIEFTSIADFTIELGFESSGGSGTNPFLCIDGVRLLKIGEADTTPLLGDVNHDGLISTLDLTALVAIILNKNEASSSGYDYTAADVNEDNNITIADVTALVNILLKK